GDVDLRLVQRAAQNDHIRYLETNARRLSSIVEMRVMAGVPGGERHLAELKAVDGAYPLVGSIEVNPAQSLNDALVLRNGVWGAIADQNLLDRLGLSVGDRVTVGDTAFEVRGTVVREPDRVATVFNFGPRLMTTMDALEETGLIQPGSQIRYHYRVILDDTANPTEWVDTLRETFPKAGWHIRDTSGAAPGLERFVTRFSLFLGFVGMAALLIGGIGVGNAVTAYMERKTTVIATMKCLGAPSRLVFMVYFLQIGVLALVGIMAGLLLGGILPAFALHALAGHLPVPARAGFYPWPLAMAALFGVLSAATFAIWPLMRSRRVPAAQLFRAGISPEGIRDPLAVFITGVAALTLAALIILTASERSFAYWFVGGTIVAMLALRGGGALVTAAARRFRHLPNALWRLGLGNLYRPGNRTASVMLSLGLGLSVLVAVTQIEGNLRYQINERVPEQAPALFFIDIQPDQVKAFDETVKAVPGAGTLKRMPSLRGRIVAIKGQPIENVTIAPDAEWAIRGDRALTYSAEPLDGAEITSGEWWPPDYTGPPLISLDGKLARGFGIGLGDTLTLSVLGREIEAKITSLRRIDWRSMRFDFAIIFAPGVLEGAPHSHIAAAQATAEAETAIERAIGDRFTNISTIRVREALDAAKGMLEGIGAAVRAASAVAIVVGVLVLGGAIAVGSNRRIADAVIFKVLGATRRAVLFAFLVEYCLLGLATGLIAAAVGTITAWAVVVFLMGSAWVFLPGAAVAVIAGCVLFTLLAGLAGTWRALGLKAAPLLRNE
ncbi:MAG: ABC transporter permease, partial [Rhodospirillales bacterium]|nr:ABC transporter permease [Rhodospirillales bacterium]